MPRTKTLFWEVKSWFGLHEPGFPSRDLLLDKVLLFSSLQSPSLLQEMCSEWFVPSL